MSQETVPFVVYSQLIFKLALSCFIPPGLSSIMYSPFPLYSEVLKVLPENVPS